ncbi:hypothetical protein TWF696_009622 [Orbilia brochopaga]|uniref:Uncharacterized protein n=1 Tax=Orbilia brochopaga TaxID=3140254 RepID=A0AAV9UBJ8_9PEZI
MNNGIFGKTKSLQPAPHPISLSPPPPCLVNQALDAKPPPPQTIDSDTLKALNKVTIYSAWRASVQRCHPLADLDKKKWIILLERAGYRRIGSLLHVGMAKTAEALSSAILAKLDRPRRTNWRILKSVSWITWEDIDNLVSSLAESGERAGTANVIDCTLDPDGIIGSVEAQNSKYQVDEETHKLKVRDECLGSTEPASLTPVQATLKVEGPHKSGHAAGLSAHKVEDIANDAKPASLKRPRGIRTPANRFSEAEDRQNSSAILFSDSDMESEDRPSKMNKSTRGQENTGDPSNRPEHGTGESPDCSERQVAMGETMIPPQPRNNILIPSDLSKKRDFELWTETREFRSGRVIGRYKPTQSKLTSILPPQSTICETTNIQAPPIVSIPPGDTFVKPDRPPVPETSKTSHKQVVAATRQRSVGTQTVPDSTAKRPIIIPQKVLADIFTEHDALRYQARKSTRLCEQIEKRLPQLMTMETKLSQITGIEGQIRNMQEILVNILDFCKGRDISDPPSVNGPDNSN